MWDGLFEHFVEVMKLCLSKAVCNALLTFSELEETLLDVECFMNNRLLIYIVDDFEKQTITPNSILRGEPSILIDDKAETLESSGDIWQR